MQLSNLIGPFVPRDRPEKNDIGRLASKPSNIVFKASNDADPEAAASSRVVAKSHSPRFQTYTKEQLLYQTLVSNFIFDNN